MEKFLISGIVGAAAGVLADTEWQVSFLAGEVYLERSRRTGTSKYLKKSSLPRSKETSSINAQPMRQKTLKSFNKIVTLRKTMGTPFSPILKMSIL